jgi:hypothetical protein
MLAELAVWPFIRALPAARKLGYAQAQVSLWSRARRCGAAWEAHRAATKAFALEVALAAKKQDCAWVLGAGTLEDIPLDGLRAAFKSVVVIDIAFLPWIWRRLGTMPGVQPVLGDVTGLAEAVACWWPGVPLPQAEDGALLKLAAPRPDCILSLNILSQLPLLPLGHLEKQGLGEKERGLLARGILSAHLSALAQFDGTSALVTDQRRIWRNRAGEAVAVESAVEELTLPPAAQEWTWAIAPRGEIDPELSLDFRVVACRLGRG